MTRKVELWKRNNTSIFLQNILKGEINVDQRFGMYGDASRKSLLSLSSRYSSDMLDGDEI